MQAIFAMLGLMAVLRLCNWVLNEIYPSAILHNVSILAFVVLFFLLGVAFYQWSLATPRHRFLSVKKLIPMRCLVFLYIRYSSS